MELTAQEQASKEIYSYAKWAGGWGMAPLMADVPAVTYLQVKMIGRLSEIYGQGKLEGSDRVKQILAALLGAAVPGRLGYYGVRTMMYSIPLVGLFAGLATAPAFNYASTLAIGRLFQKHFASGGTLLSFDVDAAKDAVQTEMKRAADEGKSAVGKPATSVRA
jgi:uncharacterized protein (DUF697 family)